MSKAKKAKKYTAEDFKDAYAQMNELPQGKLMIGDENDPHHSENVWVRKVRIGNEHLLIIDNDPLTSCFCYKDVVRRKPGSLLGAELVYAHLRGRCVVKFADNEADPAYTARQALYDAAKQHGCEVSFCFLGAALLYTPTPEDTEAVTAALKAAGATSISEFRVRPGVKDL